MLLPIIGAWFQYLFHSPSGVLFTFPSRYSFTIGHQVVFSLTPWSGQIPTEFHVLYGTWVSIPIIHCMFRLQDCHFLRSPFPERSTTYNFKSRDKHISIDLTPQHRYCNACMLTQHRFLAVPVSLTTTQGITFVFSSSHYLDVSVHAVRLFTLCVQIKISSLH